MGADQVAHMKRTVADRTRKKTLTRRQWLSAGAGTLAASAAAPLLTGGASLEAAASPRPAPPPQSGTRKVPMTLSCWDYDRTRALMDGRVQVGGRRPDLSPAGHRRDILPPGAIP